MPEYDSKHWSYFFGCAVHRGQLPPCARCISEKHPDLVVLDAEIKDRDVEPEWTQAYCEYMAWPLCYQ